MEITNEQILKIAYLYARESCKDNQKTKLIDKLLVKQGIFMFVNENKSYQGFKGHQKYNDTISTINALLKSEGVK